MKFILFITAAFIVSARPCQAQRGDSLATLKLFMKVCNSYKQLPVQVDLDITNSANILVTAEDSSHTRATFVLRKEGSYIDLGDMEQIANDSVILLVSKRMKRMLLYSNTRSVSQQLQLSVGLQLKDSSLLRLAGRYTAAGTAIAKDTAEIGITGRLVVRMTNLPAETIRLKYDPVSYQPYEIRQVKRSLRPLTETDYRQLLSQGFTEGGALIHSDNRYYVVREQVSVYRYDRITHAPGDRLPVTIDDRITGDGNGNYKAISKYEGYSVSREF